MQDMSEVDFLVLSEEDKCFFDNYASSKNVMPVESVQSKSELLIENAEAIMKLMEEYKSNLDDILTTIVAWESGLPVIIYNAIVNILFKYFNFLKFFQA